MLGGGILFSSLAATGHATAADPSSYTTDGPKIVMTTEAVSSFVPWAIMIKADAADAESIWIDLNNNQKYDEGEEAKVNTDRADEYSKTGATVTIYGAVRELTVNLQALSSLEVSGNEKLQVLNCYKNKLTSLDLSKNKELTDLTCRNNQLTRLDLTANGKLQLLDCAVNNLADLKLNPSAPLQKVNLSSNQFIGWSAAGYAQLEEVACFGNFISSEKMIALIQSLPMRTAENPGSFYMVDTQDFPNGRYSADIVKEATKKNWKVFDNKGGKKGVTYEGTSLTIAPGEEEYIIITTSKTTGQGSDTWGIKAVLADNADAGKAWIDFNGNGVKDANEIIKENGVPIYLKKTVPTIVAYGKFAAFDCGGLEVADNCISAIDLTHAPTLVVLTAYRNELTELDVTHMPAIYELDCSEASLTKLLIPKENILHLVSCYNNKLNEQAIRDLVDRLCDRYKVNTAEFEPGSFYAINTSNSEEGNFVSVYAADVARSKGWDTYDWQDGENKGKNPYAGKPGAAVLLQTEAVALYPTVASETITLSIPNKEGARVQIYALDGTLVLNTVATSSKTTIDVSSLSEGVYFLHVANRIERFVVAR